MRSARDVRGLFSPERVAIVGATEREGSVGRAIASNLAGFDGEAVAVNPSYESVLGLACYPELSAVPGEVDLVVVAVPAEVAVEEVRQAAEAGVRNVVVVTAGFGEAGSEGAARERELRRVAEAHDLNLVGPNCLGVLGTSVGLNATFGPVDAEPGPVSMLSQSGAFVTAVLDWAGEAGVGFRNVVSLGNKAVLDETDFLHAWGEDPETTVVLGYLESIEEGRAFVETAREVTRETPVVVVKSGRTEAGAQAASSHTGAIAGSERAYEAGLREAGVLRAADVQELFDFAVALAGQPLPDSEGVGVVTNAGGPGVLTTDAVGDSGLSMASFEGATLAALDDLLPDAANVYNPVDVLGDADLDRFRDALDAVLADDGVGAAVVLSAPVAVLDFEDLASVIVDRQAAHGKPVVTCLMGGERVAPAEETLREAGVPNYFDPARAVDSLDALAAYREVTGREHREPTAFDVDRERAREVLSRAAERGTTRLGVEAMALLDAYGVPTPAGELVDGQDEAVAAAAALDGDVVMKVASPDVLHKSDVGGVKVGVPPGEVADTYENLLTRVRSYQPDATVLGVLVQERLDLDRATETIVGANRDPQFGPLVLFGLGGVFVEVLEDVAVRLAPVDERAATEMVGEIRAAPLLRGARGREPVDRAAVVESVQRLSQLVTDFPAVLELDVNPLVAGPDGVRAADLRLTIDPEEL